MKRIATAAVVGANGKVGSALVRALPKAGVRIVPPERAQLILLAVPDRAVKQVASALHADPEQLVAHLAGALDLEVLAPARRRGSIHPLRAFTGGEDFRGAAAGIAASSAGGRAQLADLARRLGMTPLPVRGRRALYHAAAVLAAGAQVALFTEAVDVFRQATGATVASARAALLPLALGALQQGGITGPAVRGDQQTIAAHRKALPAKQRTLYDLLTRAMLEHARRQRPRHRP